MSARQWGIFYCLAIASVLGAVLFPLTLGDQWGNAAAAAGAVAAAWTALWAILEVRQDRLDRQRPIVVIRRRYRRNGAMYIDVQNVGEGAAHGVSFSFDPVPTVIVNMRPITDIPVFGQGCPVLQPREQLLPVLLAFGARLNELPVTSFIVTVKYRDARGRDYAERYPIDLAREFELQPPPKTTPEILEDVVEQLKALTRATQADRD